MKKILQFILCFHLGLSGIAQTKETILLTDSFDNNNNNWPLNKYGNGESTKITNGELIINPKDKLGLFLTVPVSVPENKNLFVSATIKFNNEEGTTQGSGICFGFKGYLYSIFFSVTSHGEYSVKKAVNDNVETAASYVGSGFFKKEEGAVNELAVRVESGTWYFYINSHYEYSMPYAVNKLRDKNFGFFSYGPASVSFDNLLVKEYEGSKVPLITRLGGNNTVEVLAKYFLGSLLMDSKTSQKFSKTDFRKFSDNMIAYLCTAAGGDCKNDGTDLKAELKKMQVTESDINLYEEKMAATAEHFFVPEKEKKDLVDLLNSLKPPVIEKKPVKKPAAKKQSKN